MKTHCQHTPFTYYPSPFPIFQPNPQDSLLLFISSLHLCIRCTQHTTISVLLTQIKAGSYKEFLFICRFTAEIYQKESNTSLPKVKCEYRLWQYTAGPFWKSFENLVCTWCAVFIFLCFKTPGWRWTPKNSNSTVAARWIFTFQLSLPKVPILSSVVQSGQNFLLGPVS